MYKKGAFTGLLLLCIALCFSTGFAAHSSVKISTYTAEADVDFADTGTFDVSLRLINGAGLLPGTTNVITWSNIEEDTAWKASNAVIQITNTYRTAGWHVRIYTDNMASNADPKWDQVEKPTNTYNCHGLLAVEESSTTASIPICWRVTDNTTNTYDIGVTDGDLYSITLGTSFPCFLYMKDFSTPDDLTTDPADKYDEKFYNTRAEAVAAGQKAIDSYDSVMVADQSRGLHGASGPTWYEREDSLFYIYLGAKFTNASTGMVYKTNQLKVELIIDP